MAKTTKKKIVLLSSTFQDQDSVQTIAMNLYHCYAQLKNIETILVVIDEATCLSDQFKQLDHLIIIHPLVVLDPLFKKIISNLDNKTKITFHVFGDYVRKSSVYLSLNDLLLGRNITFLSASHAYKILIDKSQFSGNSLVIPFPCNKKDFFYSIKQRSAFRKRYGLKDNQKVLIYSGRISPQKNISLLIEIFALLKKKNKSISLFILGNVDDFEKATFYEKEYRPGEYFFELSTLVKKHNIQDLFFLPRVNAKELNQAYNGADLFISLSLYHDEDFGYSPIEALSTGCPVFLTSWGGYKDLGLTINSNQVHYTKVKFSKSSLLLSKRAIVTDLERILKKNRSQRSKKADVFKTQYKKIVVGGKLLSALSTDNIFKGFSEKFAILALKMQSIQKADLSLYRYFYQSFWKDL